MCGIVGLVQISFPKTNGGIVNKNPFLQMLIADSLRGVDGTGVMKTGFENPVKILKGNSDPFALMASKSWVEMWSTINAKDTTVLVGHNRSATKGKKIPENAHPFTADHITMVHNGTLEDYYCKKTMPDYGKYDVDSEALAHCIALEGIEKTVQELVMGAYALVFIDQKTRMLHLIRNKDRPLAIAIDKQLHKMMFCSEIDMLRWIVKRSLWQEKYTDICELQEDMLWSIPIDNDKLDIDKKPLKRILKSILPPAKEEFTYDDSWQCIEGVYVRSSASTTTSIPFDKKKSATTIPLIQRLPAVVIPEQAKETSDSGGLSNLTGGDKARAAILRRLYNRNGNYVAQNSYGSYQTEDSITVTVKDYIPTGAQKTAYVVEGEFAVWPNIGSASVKARVYANVVSNELIDALFDTGQMNVKIRKFLVDKDSHEVIIWASDVVPGNIMESCK